jgi:hypothetical protein
MPDAPDSRPPPAATRSRWFWLRPALTLLLILGAALLFAYATTLFRRTESVHETVPTTPITDTAELAARQRDVVGTFTTGTGPGERVITVHADGRIEFSEVGGGPSFADTYQLLRRGKAFCLVTRTSGVVDIMNIDTLSYSRDTYRRPR